MRKHLFLLLLLLTFSPSAFANVNYALDLAQGFRHEASNTLPVGYITSIQVGGTSLRADFPLKNPVTQSKMAAVGVLKGFSWTGAQGDSKYFTFNVSPQNRQAIQSLLGDAGLAGRDIKISYLIFAYNTRPPARYFTALQPKTATLSARFVVRDGRVLLGASSSLDPAVPNPPNYEVQMGLNPGRQDQFVLHTPVPGGNTGLKAWIHNGP